MRIDRYLVVDSSRLVLRHETDLDTLMVEDRLIALTDSDSLLNRCALVHPDSTAVDRYTVHEDLQTRRIGILHDGYVVAKWQHLMGVGHIRAVEGCRCTLSGRDVGQRDGLTRCFATFADGYVRLLHTNGTVTEWQ